MRWLLPLLAATLLTLAASLSSLGRFREAAEMTAPVRTLAVPRFLCEHPEALRLRRFEDRSARLECAGRILVRVSVPG